MKCSLKLWFSAGILIFFATQVNAQQTLLATTAMSSPKASVTQDIGITSVEVNYSRPAARGRKIWGGVVPFANKESERPQLPWRAGANENTTFSLSTAATINGIPIDAGTYGVHLYVYPDGETDVMLSSNAESWGSFYFDKEDVVATIPAKRQPCEHIEHLSYTFSDLTKEGALLQLSWAEEQISLNIQVDVKGTTLAHLRQEIQSRHMINAIGPLEAAQWCFYNDTNLVQALQWVNYSLSFNKMFANLKTKSQILDALERDAEAKSTMDDAMSFGSSSDLYGYTVELINQDNFEKATTVAKKSLKKHPKDWTAHYGMARVYDALKEPKKTMGHLKKAEQYCESERSKSFLKSQIEKLERNGSLG